MEDSNVVLRNVLDIAKLHCKDKYENKLQVYEDLKHRLQSEFLFGYEKELADTLKI